VPDLRDLRDAAFVGRRDLVQMLRNPETLLWVFVMPVVFFYFFGTVTGGMADAGGSADAPDPLVLQAPGDGGFLVDELRTRLEEQNYRVIPGDSVSGRGSGRSVVVGSPDDSLGLTRAVLAGEPRTVTLRPGEDGLAAQFHEVRVARAVYGVLADVAVLTGDTLDGVSPAGFHRLREAPRPLGLRVESAGRRERAPTGFSQSIPGTLVMFTMLVLLTTGGITLVVEREQGLLRRLAATPMSRAAVVLGKWGARLVLGLVFIAFAVATGTLLFGMDWGNAPAALGGLMVAWAAFNASLGLLLAGVARSEAQASGVAVLVTLLLAALGGAWWPIEITPGWMQTLALALPTGWAMDGMHRLVNFGYGAGAVAWHLGALLAATAVVTVLAVRTFRYR